MKKLSFNNRLSAYILLLFLVFSLLIIALQYNREIEFRKRQLENTLDNITEMTHKFIENNGIQLNNDFAALDSLMEIIPRSNIRITFIDPQGIVRYDSEVSDVGSMENHLKRPELQLSLRNAYGSNIRASSTTGNEYFYFSKYYHNYYLRTAALYDVNIRDFLKAERMFIFFLIGICFLTAAVLLFMTKNLGNTIIRLKDFTLSIARGESVQQMEFPSGELGIVTIEIAKIHDQLNATKEELNVERNKLNNHLHALNEGVAFFSSRRKKLFANNHFFHFLNHISEKSTISAEDIFKVEALGPMNDFIKRQLSENEPVNHHELQQFHMDLSKNNMYFNITCVFFEDRNFEVVIRDNTRLEKRKLLKQQMTSNISHELKTPAATILAYLETLKENKLETKQKDRFINKAYLQARKLSDLLEDLSTLNKIEEATNQFHFEKVKLYDIVRDVEDNLQLKMAENKVTCKLDLDKQLELNGNKSLLFSIFYNLFDNAIKYGGEGIEITLNNYLDENDFLHFSFANTGNDIAEKHLTRIFERFYRVDSGRSRKTGGTGLGLAIVKNAIQLHGGNITARKNKDGGLEFLFTLSKK